MTKRDKLTTVLSTKGQVILPKTIRDQRHWNAGTKLLVENTAEGVLLKAVPSFTPTTLDKVFGMLPYSGKAKTIEEMDESVLAEARRRARD